MRNTLVLSINQTVSAWRTVPLAYASVKHMRLVSPQFHSAQQQNTLFIPIKRYQKNNNHQAPPATTDIITQKKNTVSILISGIKSSYTTLKNYFKDTATYYETSSAPLPSFNTLLANQIKPLIFYGEQHFTQAEIESLTPSTIRIIAAHGNIDHEKTHTMNFYRQGKEPSSNILSSFKDKQQVLFVGTCLGGAIHYDSNITKTLGSSILVTLTDEHSRSFSLIDDEITTCITELSNQQIDPKLIIFALISRYPLTITVRMPGKNSKAFGGNIEAMGVVPYLLTLQRALSYLGIKITHIPWFSNLIPTNRHRYHALALFTHIANWDCLSEEKKNGIFNKLKTTKATIFDRMYYMEGSSLLNGILVYSKINYADKLRFIQLWIAAGANINIISPKDGKSLLHIALTLKSPEIFHQLITAGADIHVRDKKGDTPANEAARRNLHETLIILAQNNADLNLPNNKGQAPIHIAVACDHIESVQVLIKYGARVNVLDNGATLPSMYACTKTKEILLEALHEQNTQPFAPTLNYGISPFKRALFFNSKNSPTERKCEIESSNSQIIP